MSTFVEFYTILLGFINFRLYHQLNLAYPPKFSGVSGPSSDEKSLVDENVFVAERIAALNHSVLRTSTETHEEEVDLDTFDTEDDAEKLEEKKKEAEKIKKLKTLFKGMKFFLNREVPREPLVFLIRCFGGEVSWDKNMFVGATFEETDESITHHVVDRPKMDKQYISRYYIQPQWVFDCVNARDLLPVNKYFMGAVLPPHLSPFTDPSRDQTYIPPEERALRDDTLMEKHDHVSESEEEDDDEAMNEEEEEKGEESDNEDEEMDESDDEDEEGSEDEETKKQRKEKKRKMSVTPGKLHKEVPWEENRREKQEYRLREKMIKNKHRRLYQNMMAGKKERAKEIWLLRKKRRLHDAAQAEERKAKKKQAKKAEN